MKNIVDVLVVTCDETVETPKIRIINSFKCIGFAIDTIGRKNYRLILGLRLKLRL